MNIFDRLSNLLEKAARYSPRVAMMVVVTMVITTTLLALSLGLLFVAAGGDWSWDLFWTITIVGVLFGLVLVGAAILKVSGIQDARLKWIGLIGITVLAGILFRLTSLIPTAGPTWTTIMRIGFATVVVSTFMTLIFGTFRAIKPLSVVGLILICVGALSGIDQWGLLEAKKRAVEQRSGPAASATAGTIPTKMQWCWSKPPGVKGYKPGLRATCLDVRIDTDTQSVLSFTVFHRNGGEMESSSFFLDRVSGKGHWKNNGDLGGTGGDWFEQPVAPGSGMRILGQFRDTGRDNAWIPFYITGVAQTDSDSVARPASRFTEKYPCSFFIEGTTYSARIVGPGRFEVVSERRRSNTQFMLVTAEMGTWEQTYPKDRGAFEFTNPDFTTQTLNGFSWSSSSPSTKRPMSFSCPNLSTLIPSP
ncbi:MAG: hypothetical protein AMXMBFR44_5960 [Candidatus Campbellbacteria bacterium]